VNLNLLFALWVGEKHDVIIVFLRERGILLVFLIQVAGNSYEEKEKNEVENQQGVTLGVA
jgi:hypothetical protein